MIKNFFIFLLLKSKMFILSSLILLYTFLCSFMYVNNISSSLQKNIFRLHIIANSNDIKDQNLKYIIRDSLINYMNKICINSKSKEETIEIVSNNLDKFSQIANKIIFENGFDYNATVEIGNFEFPTKKYGDISLPSGYYDALKVKIGKASR